MKILLAVATILGGIVAVWFLWEKIFLSKSSPKEISNTWWDSSPLKKKLEKKGYSFRWSDSDAVEERLRNGFEIIFKKNLFKKRRFINKSGQVLIGRKDT